MSRDHAWNVVVNELRDQEEAIGGPPTRYGMAWAVVNALTAAGFNLTRADQLVAGAPCEVHGIRRCTICVSV